jgi:ferritin-like protein
MVEWHKPNLDPETIADIIREGREENDKKFETYAEYVGYIAKDNDRILNEYDHDHSQCEPNELTKEAMDEAIEDSMDDVFVSSLDGSESTLKEILEALGSDYDENGIPYWKKSEDYNAKQIEGRDNV